MTVPNILINSDDGMDNIILPDISIIEVNPVIFIMSMGEVPPVGPVYSMGPVYSVVPVGPSICSFRWFLT
jgi:hypothetical protein